MTTRFDAPEGFEARLLDALTEIDAARPMASAGLSSARVRRARRSRWPVAIAVVTLTLAGGGTAVASVSGLFGSAPPAVKKIFTGLDAHGASIDAAKAVRIGVIDDHVAYAAPTSSGGFCLYFGSAPRSGPTGGSCIQRGAATNEAVFSVLFGGDASILFGRVGNDRAQQVTVTFPRSGQTVTAPVADSGFFAMKIPDLSMRSMEIVIQPDPAKGVISKDGEPILSWVPDRLLEISAVALDSQGHVVAHGVPLLTPDPNASPTSSSLP